MSYEAMAKSTMPLNVDLLNILLSIKDEEVQTINDITTSTLVVWPSKLETRPFSLHPYTIFIHVGQLANIDR